MNILLKADDIVNKRSEDQERQYGPFDKSMAKAAKIATELCNKEITQDDMYMCMMALKLSRIAYSTKEDSLLDLVAYTAAFNNLKNN
jgi:Domain of unknown function (DUF6378)